MWRIREKEETCSNEMCILLTGALRLNGAHQLSRDKCKFTRYIRWNFHGFFSAGPCVNSSTGVFARQVDVSNSIGISLSLSLSPSLSLSLFLSSSLRLSFYLDLNGLHRFEFPFTWSLIRVQLPIGAFQIPNWNYLSWLRTGFVSNWQPSPLPPSQYIPRRLESICGFWPC